MKKKFPISVFAAVVSSVILLLAISSSRVHVRPTNAQPAGPNGLPYVYTSGGILAGSGTPATPLTATISTDATLTGTGSAGSPLTAVGALGTVDFAIFGDGSDGTHTFDGTTTILGLVPSANTYTLTRDIFCSGCTINVGVSVTGPYRFFDNGNLVLNGKIHRNGPTGGTPTACTALAAGTLPAGIAGGVGGATSGTAAGNGGGTSTPFGCTAGTAAAGAAGSLCGGGGGGAGASGNGGTGGAVAIASAVVGSPRHLRLGMEGINRQTNLWTVATSGGGGRGDAGNARAGGAGGCTGGYTVVSARSITGTGSIEARGGDGGPGQAGGNTGGGAGASGSWIFVVIGSGSYPTTVVTGGAGGAGQGTGATGGAGGSGIVVKYKLGVQ